MKRFTSLLLAIDQTTSTSTKTELIAQYLQEESLEKNKLWTIALFTGKKPQRTVNTTLLRKWCAAEANIPLWLFEHTYHIIGDLAETISLILPEYNITSTSKSMSEWIEEMMALKNADEEEKQIFIINAWKSMDRPSIWVFNKLVTGGFRVGVAKNILIKALSMFTGQDPTKIAYHLTGNWTPLKTTWSELFNFQDITSDHSKPFPFYLAHALPNENIPDIDPQIWVAEWKWDGIRGQLIKRKGEVYLWSRGEELITDKFPEFQRLTS
ncbi:MAG: ATP-dependent DNA ligase, partial [Saprospiraceae bacterium]